MPVAARPPAGAAPARWAVTAPDEAVRPARPAPAAAFLATPEGAPEPLAVARELVWPPPALAAPVPVLTDVAG